MCIGVVIAGNTIVGRRKPFSPFLLKIFFLFNCVSFLLVILGSFFGLSSPYYHLFLIVIFWVFLVFFFISYVLFCFCFFVFLFFFFFFLCRMQTWKKLKKSQVIPSFGTNFETPFE